ncbi:MAG: hypothetical protein ACQERB_07470 [Promethearchaeati archaeon]
MIESRKKINLNDLILNSALTAINIQNDNGSFPPGKNGPWNNKDTPLRVTAHYGILLLEAYRRTNESKFKSNAKRGYDYVIRKNNRPFNFSFKCRESDDPAINGNGLIGQAWIIESLIKAYEVLNDELYLDIVEDVISKHKFNYEYNLWHTLGIDGKILDIHTTFNQQLWFSLMAYKFTQLRNSKEILNSSSKFFKNLDSLIKFDKFIRMLIRSKNLDIKKISRNYIKSIAAKTLLKDHFRKISEGYLSFTLLGIAKLFDLDQNLKIWNNNNFKKKLRSSMLYLDEKLYYEDQNKYAFQYNPIGFEAAIIQEKFSEYLNMQYKHSIEDWIQKQLYNHYNFEKYLMNRNTVDPQTLAARIYEITDIEQNEIVFN